MSNDNGFHRFTGTEGYIASEPLIDAVNCAVALERPLLIKGEPGTGKTLLAQHIAEGLGMPLENWHIKSTSKAAAGLYVYDTVQRLNARRFGPGDVADVEFPNDLLHELDNMRFNILETDREITATERPVVIITSNNEKELPDAFLRRCIFHFIEFPDPNLMRQIIAVPHPRLEEELLDQVLIKFYWLREQSELRKKPSTSELIDWIAVLLKAGIDEDKLQSHIPFVGSLLKKEQDLDALGRYNEQEGAYPVNWEELGPRYNQ